MRDSESEREKKEDFERLQSVGSKLRERERESKKVREKNQRKKKLREIKKLRVGKSSQKEFDVCSSSAK